VITAPIQIFDDVRRDLLPMLEREILARIEAQRGSFPSLNQGGWKSSEGAFEWESAPAMRALRATICDHLGGAGIGSLAHNRPNAWAMVNRAGSFHPTHRHQTAIRAGVYYVSPGNPPTPTIFELATGEDLPVEAKPGRLVIFPGNLWHRVPVYSGDAPRITIAFDLRR